MHFFRNENVRQGALDAKNEDRARALELLDQLLGQPVINVEQVQKHLSVNYNDPKNYDKKDFEQILEIFKNKLYQIAINLPAQFNQTGALGANEEPKTALKKISDLIFYCIKIFGTNNLANDLLSHIRNIREVNAKIASCLMVHSAFFEDLAKIRKSSPMTTPPGLREITTSRQQTNDEAIQVAMKLYS